MKICNQQGEARLIVLMALVAIVLAIVIILPIIKEASERQLKKADEEYEVGARRIALVDYQSDLKNHKMIYDGIHKCFVPLENVKEVEPYTSSKEYEGRYLVAHITEDGDTAFEWLTKEKIKKEADYGKTTNR